MKHLTIAYLSIFLFAGLAGCGVLESIEKSPMTASALTSIGMAKVIEACPDRIRCAEKYMSKVAEIRAAAALAQGANAETIFNIAKDKLLDGDKEISEQLIYKYVLKAAESKIKIDPDKGFTEEKAMAGLNIILDEISETSNMIRTRELRKLNQ